MRTTIYRTASAIIITAFCCYPQTTIKFASLAPTGSPYDNGIRAIAADWEKISGGKVRMIIYSGSIAGDEDDMIRKMKIGQLQAAGITGVGLCRLVKDIITIQLPMLVRTDAELQYIMEKMAPEFQTELEAKGLRVLAWMPVGWVHYFARKPVASPDQLKKMKLFVWAGDADGVLAWKEMGFHPIPLAATDIFASLQSGMIDAFSAPPLTAASYQWFTIANNMCDLTWAPLIGGIVVTTAAWKKLPADLRPRLEKAVQDRVKAMNREILQADRQAIEAMKKNGLIINAVSPDNERQWKKLADEGLAKTEGKSFQAKYRALITNYLEEFRASRQTGTAAP